MMCRILFPIFSWFLFFKIFIGRFFDRVGQTQVQYHAMWAWTGLRQQIVLCCIAIYIYNYLRNIIKHNEDFNNERTHFFIKIYPSHFILERVMFVEYERWAGDRDRLLYWPKFFLETIAALLPHLGCVAQPWVTEGPKLSVCRWSSLWHLVSNWLEPFAHLVILLSNVHMLPLFFRLFTQAHLLTDGSVEGQYITVRYLGNLVIISTTAMKMWRQ